MTDRGIPSTDRAAACPFVAFEDDRDARSTAPDHRHRCFAESVPAPRAIAHQDAYCLSPAFAVCPAFQDWARREAAAARPAPASAGTPPARQREHEEDTSGPVPLPPAEREPRHAPANAAQPIPPRKAPPRDWAAPPPWMADDDRDEDDADTTSGSVAQGAIPGWNAGGVAGGAAAGGAAAAGAAAAAPRPWAGDDRRGQGRVDPRSAGRGLADSPAARLAGPDPSLPAPARPMTTWAGATSNADDDDDALPYAPPRPQAPLGRSSAARTAASEPGRPVPAPRTPSPRDGAKPLPMDAQELFGPAWERPRRYEAYPSLRTRVGLPSLAGFSRLGIAAVALVIAAVFLFFVSPMLFGLGKHPASQPSTAPSGLASAAPTDTPLPTVAPAPTQFVYTVVAGDTVSKLAARFGVTVNAIKKANPQIKNINAIKIGDPITIPVPTAGAVSGASPSAVSGASASP